MPELPEVEVVRRGLDRWAAGRTVAAVAVGHPRAVRRHAAGSADFAARLTGRTLAGAQRRGKYLWLPLEAVPGSGGSGGIDGSDAGEAVLAHLGMSGQLLVRPPGSPDEVHLRVRLSFTDGGPELRFVDQRTFGGLALVDTDPAGLPLPVAHIARDPLDPEFDDAAFAGALRRRRTGLKRALLDQTLVSGIGNIYADEALWRARLHWARPTSTMTRARSAEVLAATREVMVEALDQGGTSFDSLYVNVNGESGYFDRELAVYGRTGLPCRRCGALVVREHFMNRSSFRCPRCQRRPPDAHG
ncbi:MAG TPA: bifunctional DNA-formamidopyrimidine glycosylase/DNA-(apurinic or apyrimidinic site) lyase [Actinomycetes bacterium]|nr:bifunctional DNA-formamidopyrimidine glycosylase/DNA-(apurinic or apyrimidinic site) lyase [Actinomycetes bacterium]